MIELDEPEFEGHDYCELIDRWNLRFELECAEGAVNELKDLGVDIGDLEVDYRVIQRYILENIYIDEDGNEKIPPDMLDEMRELIVAICNDEHTHPSDAAMLDCILDLAADDDHYAFIRWFVHCLPLMWN